MIATGCGDSKQRESTSAGNVTGSSTVSSGTGGDGGAAGDTGGAGASGAGLGGGEGVSASGGTSSTSTSSEGGMAGQGGSPASEPPPGKAGYLGLDPYTFDGGPELAGLTTSSARLFYALLEADTEYEQRPLFVFTGGIPDLSTGSIMPGASTLGLFSVFGVGRLSLNGRDLAAGLVPNPASWTDMGSLLFIDGRRSGFSYSTLEEPANDGARGAEFASNNFNNFVDAADFVRALLRFFSLHPELSDNPVVFVGQGYASIRTSLMLSYLLYPERLRETGNFAYTDPDLADEIAAHHASIFSGQADVTAAQASTQFGWQVQIQPKVGGDQEGLVDELWCQSIMPFEVAEECPPPGRDPLHIGENNGWSSRLRQASREAVSVPSSFESSLFIHPSQIVGLPATDREGAFRLSSMLAVEATFPKMPSAWSEVLGVLPDHDRYYIANVESLIFGSGNFTDGNDLACQLFIETSQHVATFVTNATLDGRVRTEVLGATLEDCASWSAVPLIDSASLDTAQREGVARPGWLTLQYNEAAEIGATTRSVRFPVYAESGHLVSVSAPLELKADVLEFLTSAGLPLGR